MTPAWDGRVLATEPPGTSESSLYVLNPTWFEKNKSKFDGVQFFIVFFMDHAEGVYLRILCLMQDYKDFLLNFSSKSFRVLHFTFIFIIHNL